MGLRVRDRGGAGGTWREVVREDCRARGPLQVEKDDRGGTMVRMGVGG